ncbi:hypothetical protein LguiA_012156 [Lonicera macranthoides]
MGKTYGDTKMEVLVDLKLRRDNFEEEIGETHLRFQRPELDGERLKPKAAKAAMIVRSSIMRIIFKGGVFDYHTKFNQD